MKTLFALALTAISTLFGGSVRIFNDSPYLLKAEVIASDGGSKGKMSINPQQQITWQDSSSGTNVWSQTPYTVIFTCKDGKQFGVLSGVQQGATVTALSSSGDRYCQPDKKKDDKSNSQNQQQTSPFTPTNPFEDQAPGSVGPPDPSQAPGDPIWGPPS
ncbi:MAG: hypothetical protein KFB93_01690 [Simkaniaceae bacterium]|nr:MAG: hypothetical protein KFB93_01690 [Simkaniaceae bacterium]